MVMTLTRAESVGLEPMGGIASFVTNGLDPAIMGMGPVPAFTMALQLADIRSEHPAARVS